MTVNENILIVGSGYVGQRLAVRLRSSGRRVWSLRRTPVPADPYALAVDLTRPGPFRLPDESFSHVIISVGLKSAPPEDYRALFLDGINYLADLLKGHPIQRMIFTSTTGVYGDAHGAWINEDTPPQPERPATVCYLEAEHQLRALSLPVVLTRLSGIYGPGRTRLIRSIQDGSAYRTSGPPQFLNHLHVDDAAAALAHLLFLNDPASLYILNDHLPAERNEVLCWLANRLNRPPPLLSADLPPRRGGNKRCCNRRLIESGYRFIHTDYRSGYSSLIEAENAV